MRIPAFIAVFLMLPSLAQADMFKCKQADGKIAFQDQPCQGTSTGSKIVVRPTPPSADSADNPAIKSFVDSANGLASELQRLSDAIEAHSRENADRNRSIRCDNARNNLGALKMERPVFRYDSKGQRQYVDDANRQSELAAAQRDVAQNCN